MLKTEMRNPNTTHIDKMNTAEMLKAISDENHNAVKAVEAALPQIAPVVDTISASLAKGGRLFFIGAGTSGRLGVLDAAECPPTFGVSSDTVNGIIAGGMNCMFKAAENAEDIYENGKADILASGISKGDVLVGISVAGGAAYVVGAIEAAKSMGAVTVALTSNFDSAIAKAADMEIVTDTGAEAITGSTRMKAGTAHKMVLNMLTTCAMVKTGHVYENMMINLKPANIKLRDRMIRILCDIVGCGKDTSQKLLEENEWNIRRAAQSIKGTL